MPNYLYLHECFVLNVEILENITKVCSEIGTWLNETNGSHPIPSCSNVDGPPVLLATAKSAFESFDNVCKFLFAGS